MVYKMFIKVSMIVLFTNFSYFTNGLSFTQNISDETRGKYVPDLIYDVTSTYLTDECVVQILYDDLFYDIDLYNVILFETIYKLKFFPTIHGHVDKYGTRKFTENTRRKFCNNFVIFCADAESMVTTIKDQRFSKVILITSMSTWQIKEFLTSPSSRRIQNLLIVSDPTLQRDFIRVKSSGSDINLYTHELHTDGLGSSLPKILTSWRINKLTRPSVALFPNKIPKGFNGHRFVVSVFKQPPFVYQRKKNIMNSNELRAWDGLEIRILKLLAEKLNISMAIRDLSNNQGNNGGDLVIKEVSKGIADIGLSGAYISNDYYDVIHYSKPHYQDCATFMTLASTALPKYRAILGPFQFAVWVCIIAIYLLGVIPLRYSERLSPDEDRGDLFENADDVGYMFWVMFGTFTTCFTFKGQKCCMTSERSTTRSIIGIYWLFTIVITAAYASSIISFITIPAFYDVVDSVNDLLKEEFRVETLDSHMWTTWFNDSSDSSTNELLENMGNVSTVGLGIYKASSEKRYAFLGSEQYLTYIVRSNYTKSDRRKKSKFHMASGCFVPLMVSLVMQKEKDYLMQIDEMILRLHENGLIQKSMLDVQSEVLRASRGGIISAIKGSIRSDAPEDRQLTVDDLQGMLLLLGIGILLGTTSLTYEIYNGCNWTEFKNNIINATPIPSIIVTSYNSRQHSSCNSNTNSNSFASTPQAERKSSATKSLNLLLHEASNILKHRRSS